MGLSYMVLYGQGQLSVRMHVTDVFTVGPRTLYIQDLQYI